MGSTAANLRGMTRRRHALLLALGALLLLVAGSAPFAHADTSGPTVNVTQPAGGSTISGVIPVAATASSDAGIQKVVFHYHDGPTNTDYDLGTDFTAPYTTCFDTTTVPNRAGLDGTVYATAYDKTGLSTTEGSGVRVANGAESDPQPTAGDSLQPCNLSLRLGTGTTKDVPATLHFASLPPKADILLALDTTGSMGAAITDAKNDADALVSQHPRRDPRREVRGRRLQGLPDGSFRRLGRLPVARRPGLHDNAGTLDCPSGVERDAVRARSRARLSVSQASGGRRLRRGLQPCLLRGLQRRGS